MALEQLYPDNLLSFWECMGIMFALVVFWRCVSVFALWRNVPKFQ